MPDNIPAESTDKFGDSWVARKAGSGGHVCSHSGQPGVVFDSAATTVINDKNLEHSVIASVSENEVLGE